MRVYNNDNGTEIARFDLSEDASTETAMVFGELYRHGTEWKFKAVGQGFCRWSVSACFPARRQCLKDAESDSPAMPGFFLGIDPLSTGEYGKGGGAESRAMLILA